MKNLARNSIRVLGLVGALFISSYSNASIIGHNVSISLSQSEFNSNSWQVNNIVIPPTTISVGDTLIINLNFVDGKVRWTDNGFSYENAVFAINDPGGPTGYVYYISDFSFSNPTGELLFNSFISNTGSAGEGILGATTNLGKDNLTNSFFEFDGLSFQFQITSATYFPITSSSFDVILVGGDFSIAAVPLPSAIWFLGSGLVCLVGFRKKTVT